MSGLTPAETIELSTAALRHSAPLGWRRRFAPWRARAAWAFYQAGVERHRRLFLSEIVTDFEASGSKHDPAHATREAGLLHEVNDQLREGIARYYETAIACAPRFAEPLYNLAALRRDSGRLEEASALFLRAARARPHARARAHALVVANAYWEAASIAEARGRLAEAESLFREALRRHGNFGPEHVRFPRLLQRLGKSEEALDHYELLMSFSHRYAAEYVEPDYLSDERVPRHADGTLFDPFALTLVHDGASQVGYFAHLYFLLPKGSEFSVAELRRTFKAPNFWPFHHYRMYKRKVRCGTTLADLIGRDLSERATCSPSNF